MLGKLTQAAAITVGALYAAGVLVVNIDLSRYGVVATTLARPEYILAGALFVVLTSIGGFAILESGRTLGLLSEDAAAGTLTNPFHWLGAVGTLLLVWVALSWVAGFQDYPTHLALTIKILLLGFMWVGLSKDLGKLFREAKDAATEPRTLGVEHAAYFGWNAGWVLVIALAYLLSYAGFVYPFLRPEFGGGLKPLAVVYMIAKAPFRSDKDLQVSTDGHVLGPALVLLDEGDSLVLAPDAGQKTWTSRLLLPEARPAIVLNKQLIAAVRYSKQR